MARHFIQIFRGETKVRTTLNKASILVTGGAGFMGSAFVEHKLAQKDFEGKLLVLDLLVHTLCEERLKAFNGDARVHFYKGDIADHSVLKEIEKKHGLDYVVHFAAETHVDKSIHDPFIFVKTNVEKTTRLLDFVRHLSQCHFHHISTDEVFGSIDEGSFYETDAYAPNSPYSASKAASDHMVRAFGKTYGLSYTTSHACNNFGPLQYPEKLLPLMTMHILQGKPLPIYGNGKQTREWLYVEDHSSGIDAILQKGVCGESYNVGSGVEMTNLTLIKKLFKIMKKEGLTCEDQVDPLITFVRDRPGHDFRYSLNCDKLRSLGWAPQYSLEKGLDAMLKSWLTSQGSLESLSRDKAYIAWVEKQYGVNS
ncbi:dTDP-glucose 4,6-dehydratase [Candidatus Aerophobetes bacterium]|uniref:dTDP-glucose 4,6-dehydratase n=1 Tax=Aerophobetes bacterium TaxID=2030807 RepID=A0A2A4X5Q0_UNCAE|nr:MAG: dTDP-glucose 4,6-dehydratase [Candidatus Aerophobetes bacterium]